MKSDKITIRKKEYAAKGDLFERVVGILEQARAGVVRAVNSHMVLAYWLIGREIVQDIQGGEGRAAYGETVIRELSLRLNRHYGRGFSISNLKYFRQFYQTYTERVPAIGHEPSGQFENTPILHKTSVESGDGQKDCQPDGVFEDLSLAIEHAESLHGFSPHLSWTHYRTLLRVENRNERCFYEIESAKQNWSVPHLERQIHTCLFARLLKSKDKEGVMTLASKGQEVLRPVEAIKHPYVLAGRTPPGDRTRTAPAR